MGMFDWFMAVVAPGGKDGYLLLPGKLCSVTFSTFGEARRVSYEFEGRQLPSRRLAATRSFFF